MIFLQKFKDFRFNRNIVECKVKTVTTSVSNVAVLIETLWNVKSYRSLNLPWALWVLIETLWNVKFLYQFGAVVLFKF